MDRLRHKYNPDVFYQKAEAILDGMSRDETLNWYDHPCTKSLRLSLEGDMAGIVVMWLGGGYSDEDTTDGTAQKQAKARGMANALDDMLEHIENIKTLSLEAEETYGEDLHTP